MWTLRTQRNILVMNGLADVDGFKICIQVCVWLGFPPLINAVAVFVS